MSVQSMTGFTSASGEARGSRFTWELRSVNGKGLDIRLRMPPGLERLEPGARQILGRHFTRGSIQATLAVARTGNGGIQPTVNEPLLRELAELAQRLHQQFGVAPASADGLLGLRGVLETPESVETEEERAGTDKAALDALEEAAGALAASRREEGWAVSLVLSRLLDSMEELVGRVEADPSREPAAIRDRLSNQLKLLLEGGAALDPDRLLAEAALLATKADIREELDRLAIHIAAARKHLQEGGAIGRRLDFLGQEFNREANTLCSKSGSAAVSAAGLELKAVVDQFREQVQNLE
ncbi:MAG: YicC family protein [Methylobacterium mesophilicum]|nr:YicC family protein [Methylobacterium mesophilicum]